MANVAALWAEYAPRITEARERDAHAQDEAFLRLPLTLHDRRVGPLTVEKFLLLEQLGNRLVVKGDPGPDDVAAFLWVLSPDFDPDPKAGKRAMKKFNRRNWHFYLPDLYEYLGKVAEFARGKSASTPSAWVAGLVDMLASQYGWPVAQIMATPMAQVFQLASRIRSRLANDSISFSPRGDALQAEFMEKANALKGGDK